MPIGLDSSPTSYFWFWEMAAQEGVPVCLETISS